MAITRNMTIAPLHGRIGDSYAPFGPDAGRFIEEALQGTCTCMLEPAKVSEALVEATLALAGQRFGLLAITVLRSWSILTCADVLALARLVAEDEIGVQAHAGTCHCQADCDFPGRLRERIRDRLATAAGLEDSIRLG